MRTRKYELLEEVGPEAVGRQCVVELTLTAPSASSSTAAHGTATATGDLLTGGLGLSTSEAGQQQQQQRSQHTAAKRGPYRTLMPATVIGYDADLDLHTLRYDEAVAGPSYVILNSSPASSSSSNGGGSGGGFDQLQTDKLLRSIIHGSGTASAVAGALADAGFLCTQASVAIKASAAAAVAAAPSATTESAIVAPAAAAAQSLATGAPAPASLVAPSRGHEEVCYLPSRRLTWLVDVTSLPVGTRVLGRRVSVFTQHSAPEPPQPSQPFTAAAVSWQASTVHPSAASTGDTSATTTILAVKATLNSTSGAGTSGAGTSGVSAAYAGGVLRPGTITEYIPPSFLLDLRSSSSQVGSHALHSASEGDATAPPKAGVASTLEASRAASGAGDSATGPLHLYTMTPARTSVMTMTLRPTAGSAAAAMPQLNLPEAAAAAAPATATVTAAPSFAAVESRRQETLLPAQPAEMQREQQTLATIEAGESSSAAEARERALSTVAAEAAVDDLFASLSARSASTLSGVRLSIGEQARRRLTSLYGPPAATTDAQSSGVPIKPAAAAENRAAKSIQTPPVASGTSVSTEAARRPPMTGIRRPPVSDIRRSPLRPDPRALVKVVWDDGNALTCQLGDLRFAWLEDHVPYVPPPPPPPPPPPQQSGSSKHASASASAPTDGAASLIATLVSTTAGATVSAEASEAGGRERSMATLSDDAAEAVTTASEHAAAAAEAAPAGTEAVVAAGAGAGEQGFNGIAPSVPTPSPSRVGLLNMGNTCWLNAVLQVRCLFWALVSAGSTPCCRCVVILGALSAGSTPCCSA